jgi:hypothetical protein
VDGSSEDVVADLQVVEAELKAYGHGLEERPRLVVLTKAELLDSEEIAERLEALAAHGRSADSLPSLGAPLAISAATRSGLDPLLAMVWQELGIDRPAPEIRALDGAAGPGGDGVTAAGGLPSGAAPETEAAEVLLVPLTRPRTPRGATGAGGSPPDASETVRSPDGLDGDPLESADPTGESTAADPFGS